MDGGAFSTTDVPGLSSDEEVDMEIQQLVGGSTPTSVRIAPRSPTFENLGLFRTSADGQRVVQEGVGFATPPRPGRASSATSLLGEAFLSTSGNNSESRNVRDSLRQEDPKFAQDDLQTSPATPPSVLNRAPRELTPPPLPPNSSQQEEVQPAPALPPRHPYKERSGFSGIHHRDNSEASLLSAITMDTAQGLLSHEKQGRRCIVSSEMSLSLLQQPLLDDLPDQKSMSSCGFSLQQRPSNRRRSSTWSFSNSTSKLLLPKDVYLPGCDVLDKTSEATAFHRVSNPPSMQALLNDSKTIGKSLDCQKSCSNNRSGESETEERMSNESEEKYIEMGESIGEVVELTKGFLSVHLISFCFLVLLWIHQKIQDLEENPATGLLNAVTGVLVGFMVREGMQLSFDIQNEHGARKASNRGAPNLFGQQFVFFSIVGVLLACAIPSYSMSGDFQSMLQNRDFISSVSNVRLWKFLLMMLGSILLLYSIKKTLEMVASSLAVSAFLARDRKQVSVLIQQLKILHLVRRKANRWETARLRDNHGPGCAWEKEPFEKSCTALLKALDEVVEKNRSKTTEDILHQYGLYCIQSGQVDYSILQERIMKNSADFWSSDILMEMFRPTSAGKVSTESFVRTVKRVVTTGDELNRRFNSVKSRMWYSLLLFSCLIVLGFAVGAEYIELTHVSLFVLAGNCAAFGPLFVGAVRFCAAAFLFPDSCLAIGEHVQFSGVGSAFVVEEIDLLKTRFRAEKGCRLLSVSNQNMDRLVPVVIDKTQLSIKVQVEKGLSNHELSSFRDSVVSFVVSHPEVFSSRNVGIKAIEVNADGSVVYEVNANVWKGEPLMDRCVEISVFCRNAAKQLGIS